MNSPVVFAPRSSVSERFPPHDDSTSLRLTPTPVGNYRCPVSTPANYVPCAGRIRRTKPLQDVFKQPSQASRSPVGGRPHPRPRLTGLSRPARPPRAVPRGSAGIDYYYVDKNENVREENLTNTHWLRSLCSQPVEEILGKYRSRTDFKRTHQTMVRACSTPGERSLVNAWETNLLHRPKTGYGFGSPKPSASKSAGATARSGNHGESGARRFPLRQGATAAGRALYAGRATKSEPSMSRAQHVPELTLGSEEEEEQLEWRDAYSQSPRTLGRPGSAKRRLSARSQMSHVSHHHQQQQRFTPRSDGTMDGDARTNISNPGEFQHAHQLCTTRPPVKGFLLDESVSEVGEGVEVGMEKGGSPRSSPRMVKPSPRPRYVSFTTQFFQETDGHGHVHTYSKMSRGPENLPYISNNKRVSSMLYNTGVYRKQQPNVTNVSGDVEMATGRAPSTDEDNKVPIAGTSPSENYRGP